MLGFPERPIKPTAKRFRIEQPLSPQPSVQPEQSSRQAPWKVAILANWKESAEIDRWPLVLSTIGWIHLGVFSICQWMFSHGDKTPSRYILAWSIELLLVILAIRTIAQKGWSRRSPIVGFGLRVWCTFLILSFNTASLNTLSGLSSDWFKLAWAPLSTFGFAAMAYAATPWFFVPAVQMYFTGLLLVWLPNWNYLIYGLSWCLALQIVGLAVRRAAESRKPNSSARAGAGRFTQSTRDSLEPAG